MVPPSNHESLCITTRPDCHREYNPVKWNHKSFGCGSVGWVVVLEFRDPGFKSSPWQILITVKSVQETKIKKKRPQMAQLQKILQKIAIKSKFYIIKNEKGSQNVFLSSRICTFLQFKKIFFTFGFKS